MQDTELRGEDEGTSTSGRDSRPPMTFDELLSTTQVGFGLNHVAIAVITGIRRRLKPSQCQLAEVYRQCCVSLCPSAQLP